MDSTNTGLHASENKFAPTYIERKAVELLSILLADVVTDAEVAARDLQISDASFARLRRATDRVACAQSVLETMSEIAGKTAGVAGTSPTGSEAERDLGTIRTAAMRAEVELLAREWPDEYGSISTRS
jgi:hypothetical protein